MLKKRLGFMAATLACALTTVACAPEVNEPEVEQPDTGNEEADGGEDTGGEEVVEINFWNFPNFATIDETPGKYEEQMIEAFEAQNPGIKVNYEIISFNDGPAKINTAIESGTAPDVVYDAPGRITTLARNGVLAPITDMFSDDVKNDMDEAVLAASGFDGEMYMYPINTAPFMMAFNKTMLEELDLLDLLPLDTPTRSWTVAEYETLLRALKDAGVSSPAIFYAKSSAGDQGTRAFISNLYNSWISNDDLTAYTINDEGGVKSLQWTVDAINEGLLVNGSALASSDAIDEFVAGRAASTILYSPGLKAMNDEKTDFETVFVPYPNEGGEPVLEFLIGGPCVFDNGDAARIEASKTFIDFMANDSTWGEKNVVATGSFSARKSMTGLYDDAEMIYNADMTNYYGTYYNTIVGFDEMRTFWFPMLQKAIGGGDVQEALDEFAQSSNETIK